MPKPLRPLTLGEILDRTAQLYRRIFFLFAGVAAVPSAVVVGAMLGRTMFFHTARRPGSGSTGGLLLYTLIEFALLLLGVSYIHAALTAVAVDVHLERNITIRAVALGVLQRFRRYLWLTTLQGLITLGIPGAVAFALVIPLGIIVNQSRGNRSTVDLVGTLVIFLVLAAGIAALWLTARLALAVAVCRAEEKGAWAAIKRATALSKGARGKVALVFLLFYSIAMVVIVVRLAIVAAAGKLSGHHLSGFPLTVTQIFEMLYSYATEMLLTPFVATGLAVLYYDQRIRLEGYDIEWMMQQAGLSPELVAAGSPPSHSPQPSAPATVKEL